MAREITYNNFEISREVFTPNITTNHAITYTNLPMPENLVITWPYTDRPNDRPSSPQENQCLISHFLTSLGAQVKTDFTHPCCDQLTAVKKGYPLTSITWPYRGFRCRPIEVEYFLKLCADKLLVFKWSRTHVYFLKNSYKKCCVHVGMAPHYYDFDFKLTSDVKIQPVI